MSGLERTVKRRRLSLSINEFDEPSPHFSSAPTVSWGQDTGSDDDPLQPIPRQPPPTTEPRGNTSTTKEYVLQIGARPRSYEKTYRVRGIPNNYNREKTVRTLCSALGLRNLDGGLKLGSLATSPSRSEKVATVSFRETPLYLQKGDEWCFNISRDGEPDADHIDDHLPRPQFIIDSHFRGFTPLRTFESESDHVIDCIAITGLGGNAFGSFKERGGEHMWLRDSLPSDLPGVRIMIYGYDSHLVGSQSFQGMEALATQFRTHLAAIRRTTDTNSAPKPLIFIAHSLGGLVLKEALIQMQEGDATDKSNLKSTYGALFFGVPNQGMDITSLIPMVQNQPNRHFLESLGMESELLQKQRRAFLKAFPFKDSEIYCFYETLQSPTAIECGGGWVMKGKPTVLVQSSSATHGRPWECEAHHVQPINKTHSDLVKFSFRDDVYERVLYILQRFAISAVAVVRDRFMVDQSRACSPPHKNVPEGGEELHNEVQQSALIDSLAFKRIDARLLNIKGAHHKTCLWFFKQPEFRDWLDKSKSKEHHGFLWIKGKPGAGKSTIMKQALLRAKRQSAGATVISFFFNARGFDVLEKSTLGMYRSLVHQLLTALPHLRRYFILTFQSKENNGEVEDWTIDELQSFILQSMERLENKKIIIFIDALDECKEDDVRDMVGFLEDLGQEAINCDLSLNICLSSRHYPHISIRYGLSLVVENQRGHDEDIIAYVNSKLIFENDTPQIEELKSDICKKASGVFLWVVLVVQILRKTLDHGEVNQMQKRLREIPPELDGLFADILMRDEENKNRSILILQWMLFAKRSLKPIELYSAVNSGTASLNSSQRIAGQTSDQTIDRYILSCSKGLVEVSKSKDDTVQFIHETVRDFLRQENGLTRLHPNLAMNMVGSSQDILRACCFNYFDMDEIPHPKSDAEIEVVVDISTRFPFLEYATMYMFDHAETAESSGVSQKEAMKSFYERDGQKLEKWVHLYNHFQRYKNRRYTRKVNLLYIAADQNLTSIAKILIDEKVPHTACEERFGNALQAACANGHIEMARLLVDAKADPNARGGEHKCPLFAAIFSKKKEIVQLLMEAGVSLESEREPGQSLLSLAIKRENLEIIKLLIDAQGVELNSKDKRGRTPFSWAAGEGRIEVVKLLIATQGVEIDSRDNYSRTPFSWAVENGHIEIVKLLIATQGVEIDFRDNIGRTPFSWAAGEGRIEVVKLLIATQGVEIDFRDNCGRTPFSWAAKNGHIEIVKLLIATQGVEIDSRDNYGRTPFWRAAGEGRIEVVKLLIATQGVEIDSRDNDGRTPLTWAEVREQVGVVNLLKAHLQSL